MSAEAFEFESTAARVADVAIYPLKAAAPATVAGRIVTGLEVDAYGAVVDEVPDRGLVLGAVTDATNRQASFISLRGLMPGTNRQVYGGDRQLAHIRPDIVGKGMVDIHVPGMRESLPIDFSMLDDEIDPEDCWQVDIHGRALPAVSLGGHYAEPFANFLNKASAGVPVRDIRLFMRVPYGDRPMRPEYQRPGASHKIYGPDGAQLLMANGTTLRAIEQLHNMDDDEGTVRGHAGRVRANFWVDGLLPYEEDRIAAVRTRDLAMTALSACVRCVATGVHPMTAERDNEFLRLLTSTGRRGVAANSGDKGAIFGLNLAPQLAAGEKGTIRTGMPIEVAWSETSNILPAKPR